MPMTRRNVDDKNSLGKILLWSAETRDFGGFGMGDLVQLRNSGVVNSLFAGRMQCVEL